ncbi:MAG: porphobilinogen synthase, partial [Candidatus Omnitrophica bacterium]|nr:porphobilinogen synthase [Candidatus Omnitrophota bacterium]
MKEFCQMPSRLRKTAALRDLVQETKIRPDDFVMPLFFKCGTGSETVASMPGIEKMSEPVLCREVEELDRQGVKAILLFGSAGKKDENGSASYDENSQFHRAIRKIKQTSGVTVIADVCLCAYTDHGHCGIMKSTRAQELPAGQAGLGRKTCKKKSSTNGSVLMDSERTLESLAKIAVSYAVAGADVVAPSAMADGQVRAIRQGLDRNGFDGTPILSYSAKYASSFYGPFRDIADTHPSFGDRKSYQMDPGNVKEAIREAQLDVAEGADMVMVKPAILYLDVIRAVSGCVNVPVAAYNVSGEY